MIAGLIKEVVKLDKASHAYHAVRALCSTFILESCRRSLQENIVSLYSLGCYYS